ncbi:MAG: indole-3-glycerol phosphate synthase TrpC [Lachnospiraceae bacterium]
MKNDNGDIINDKRDILEEIADFTRQRVTILKQQVSLESMIEMAKRMEMGNFSFEEALKKDGMSFICEVKKASPSKGLIALDFPYLDIAREYEDAGASAISCLTEPKYFMGSDKYLQEMASVVKIPILRKDFVVDEYMVYEAKVLGASAILLICAILTDEELEIYFKIANELGLSAVFEAHDEEEVLRAAQVGARIIGVNNRNLKTFALDLNNSIRLRGLVYQDVVFISESGIKTRADIELLEAHHVNAVLIGETFMRASNKKEMLQKLKGLG